VPWRSKNKQDRFYVTSGVARGTGFNRRFIHVSKFVNRILNGEVG